MKLQTLDEIERSIGGRPKVKNTKVRIDFYMLQNDADKLKQLAENKGLALSQFVRSVMRDFLERV